MTAPTPPARPRLSAIDPALVGDRLAHLRAALADAAPGEPPAVLVASKYFEPPAIADLIAAGATLLGENRADVLAAKQQAAGDAAVQWDYIGELQSRKVRDLVGAVTRIHTLASESAVRKLHAAAADGEAIPDLLVQVNVAGDAGKGGIEPAELPVLLEAAADLPVRGLMTMPPLAAHPDESRAWFSALRELAHAHGLAELSMGTSQDALVAAEEGATVVRVGGLLTSADAWNALFPAA